jgi:hypothetical protein
MYIKPNLSTPTYVLNPQEVRFSPPEKHAALTAATLQDFTAFLHSLVQKMRAVLLVHGENNIVVGVVVYIIVVGVYMIVVVYIEVLYIVVYIVVVITHYLLSAIHYPLPTILYQGNATAEEASDLTSLVCEKMPFSALPPAQLPTRRVVQLGVGVGAGMGAIYYLLCTIYTIYYIY